MSIPQYCSLFLDSSGSSCKDSDPTEISIECGKVKEGGKDEFVEPLVAVETSESITGGTEIAESLIVDVKETSESILGVVKIIWSSAET